MKKTLHSLLVFVVLLFAVSAQGASPSWQQVTQIINGVTIRGLTNAHLAGTVKITGNGGANNDVFTLTNAATGAGTWKAPSWTNLVNVPAGFADGTDDGAGGGGSGITVTNGSGTNITLFSHDNEPDATIAPALTIKPLEKRTIPGGSLTAYVIEPPYTNDGYLGRYKLVLGVATNSFGDLRPDFTHNYGYNFSGNGSIGLAEIDTNEPSWLDTRETRWQNGVGLSQSEVWYSFGTPYTDYGTNTVFRYMGFNLNWNTTPRTYVSSDGNITIDSFYFGVPAVGSSPGNGLPAITFAKYRTNSMTQTFSQQSQISFVNNTHPDGQAILDQNGRNLAGWYQYGMSAFGAPVAAQSNAIVFLPGASLASGANNTYRWLMGASNVFVGFQWNGPSNRWEYSINSGGTTIGNLFYRPINDFSAGWKSVYLSTSLSSTAGDYRELGYVTNHSGGNLSAMVVLSVVGYNNADIGRYIIPLTTADGQSSTWKEVLPISRGLDTASPRIAVDVRGLDFKSALLRLRQLGSATENNIRVTMELYGSSNGNGSPNGTDWVDRSANSGSGATVASVFRQSALTQVLGKVGIGTNNPSSTLFVAGPTTTSGLTNTLLTASRVQMSGVDKNEASVATTGPLLGTGAAAAGTDIAGVFTGSGDYLKSDGTKGTPTGTGDLLAANNLSDVASAATARDNLGLEIGVDIPAFGANAPTATLATNALNLNGMNRYNVKDYGATGVSPNDATVAARAAQVDMNNNGGLMWFPAPTAASGVYTFSNTVLMFGQAGISSPSGAIYGNYTISGDPLAKLYMVGNTNLFEAVNGMRGALWDRLRLVGTNSTKTPDCEQNGLVLNGANGALRVNDLVAENFTAGLILEDITSFRADNLFINRNFVGVGINYKPDDVQIRGYFGHNYYGVFIGYTNRQFTSTTVVGMPMISGTFGQTGKGLVVRAGRAYLYNPYFEAITNCAIQLGLDASDAYEGSYNTTAGPQPDVFVHNMDMNAVQQIWVFRDSRIRFDNGSFSAGTKVVLKNSAADTSTVESSHPIIVENSSAVQYTVDWDRSYVNGVMVTNLNSSSPVGLITEKFSGSGDYLKRDGSSGTPSGGGTTFWNTNTPVTGVYYTNRTEVRHDFAIVNWNLNESSGSRHDNIGTNILTEIGTVESATGKVGNLATNYQVAGDYLYAPDSPELSLPNKPWTIGGWFQLFDTGQVWAMAKTNEWKLYYTGSAVNRLRFQWGDADLINAETWNPGTSTNKFVLVWYDGTDLSIQVNMGNVYSTNLSTSSGAITPPTDGTDGFSLIRGATANVVVNADEVFIADRLLTTFERTNLYNNLSGRTLSAPLLKAIDITARTVSGSGSNLYDLNASKATAGTLPAGRLPALTGDVTTSVGSAATTIAADAVTYAKMQNVSATSRVLGRKTAGAGDTEELTSSELLDFIGSTRGSLLYKGASGWSILTPGTSGHFLKTLGAGADPAWDAAGSGSVPEYANGQDLAEFVTSDSASLRYSDDTTAINIDTAAGKQIQMKGLISLQKADGTELASFGGSGSLLKSDNTTVQLSVYNSGVSVSGGSLSGSGSGLTGDDEALGSGFNGDTTLPTKNAVHDWVAVGDPDYDGKPSVLDIATASLVKVDSSGNASAATFADRTLLGMVTGYVTADQATTSGTAVNATGFSFSIAANEIWSAEFYMFFTASTAPAIAKYAVDVPASATIIAHSIGASTSQTVTADATLSGLTWSGSGTQGIRIQVFVNNSSNAGTVQLMFASGDGSGTATIKAGSYFVARRLN